MSHTTRYLPPQGHQRACSEYLPVGRGMRGRCRRKKKGFYMREYTASRIVNITN